MAPYGNVIINQQTTSAIPLTHRSRSHINLLLGPNERGALIQMLEFNPPAHLLQHVLAIQHPRIALIIHALHQTSSAGFEKEGHAVPLFSRRTPDAMAGYLESATGHEIANVDDDGSGHVGRGDSFAVGPKGFQSSGLVVV